MSNMRILICTVSENLAFSVASSTGNFRGENQRRLTAMEALLDKAKEEKVDLVVLPGGYFATNGNVQNTPLLRQIWAAIKTRRVPVCFGIDAAQKVLKKKKQRGYACAWTPQDGCVPIPLHLWRQRSMTWRDRISHHEASERRYVHIGKRRVTLLMCGEVFNRQICGATQGQGIQIVVDMVHTGKGFRSTRTLEMWSSAQPISAALLSCHAKKVGAMKRWAVNGKDQSDNRIDILVAARPIRIEGRIVTVP